MKVEQIHYKNPLHILWIAPLQAIVFYPLALITLPFHLTMLTYFYTKHWLVHKESKHIVRKEISEYLEKHFNFPKTNTEIKNG